MLQNDDNQLNDCFCFPSRSFPLFFSDKLQKLTSKVPPLWPKKSLTTATLRHRSHTPRGCKPCSLSVLVIESLVSPKYTKTSVRAAKLEKYTEISWWLPWGCCVCVCTIWIDVKLLIIAGACGTHVLPHAMKLWAWAGRETWPVSGPCRLYIYIYV